VLISAICGVFYYADSRYALFRLKEIILTSGDVIPEEVIWQALPRDAMNFWPSLTFGGGTFEKRIANYYPISVKLSLAGWGKYKLSIVPLDVLLAVSWNSKIWWLSSDGRMWPAALPAGEMVKNIRYPKRPILAWDAQLPLPIDPEKQMGDIFPSSLPMEKIKKWYDTIERTEWNKDIYCIMAKKIDGRQVVQILLGSKERITGEIVVKDDASDWLSLAAALKNKNIYPAASGEVPMGLSVNATYADMKFTVSERGQM
jgi:hypothetical protein